MVTEGFKCPNAGSRKEPKIFVLSNDTIIAFLGGFIHKAFYAGEGVNGGRIRIYETLLLLPKMPR